MKEGRSPFRRESVHRHEWDVDAAYQDDRLSKKQIAEAVLGPGPVDRISRKYGGRYNTQASSNS